MGYEDASDYIHTYVDPDREKTKSLKILPPTAEREAARRIARQKTHEKELDMLTPLIIRIISLLLRTTRHARSRHEPREKNTFFFFFFF